MEAIVSSDQMADIDTKAQQLLGIPGILLMEQAGMKAFQEFQNFFPSASETSQMVFLAGGGNNGGDALVMARKALLEGFKRISIVITTRKLNEQMQLHEKICKNIQIPVYYWNDDEEKSVELIRKAEFLFDGIAGNGIKGELHGTAELVVERVYEILKLSRKGRKDGSMDNNRPAFPKVIAVDSPSGLFDAYKLGMAVLPADLTINMGLQKRFFFFPHILPLMGKRVTVNPGFPHFLLDSISEAPVIIRSEDINLPPIPVDSYKNKRGHAAVFAGAVGTTGAAALSAQACSRMRTGLVTVFADEEIYSTIAAKLDSQMVVPKITDEHIGNEKKKFTSFIIGPGWGRAHHRFMQLLSALESDVRGVIDADGIAVLRKLLEEKRINMDDGLSGNWVITPHPGEFDPLYDLLREEKKYETNADASKKEQSLFKINDDIFEKVRFIAKKIKCCVVYKTHAIIIASPEGEIFVIEGNNPAMGTAGSGDVLSGMIGGLIAQGISITESACIGSFIHQYIGRKLFEKEGWFIAEDLVKEISQAVKYFTN
ncbi:MAG: NAD(P)H-hydrate dehydratase [Spirochaetia bacterium]|nr:NAD(P)H-hydrate dehydratase [Spirochaetia bacterium]MCF7946438.1 NAD(P)H-hydrate dehydratase [Spirochaetia bacterium]